jgi:uncharacterized membrane protein
MMWALSAGGALIGIGALRLHLKQADEAVEEPDRPVAKGYSIMIGLIGTFLFITGLSISLLWPFNFGGGVYNVLFGGPAAVGGLLLIGTAAALVLGHGLREVSYAAAITGIYLLVDAIAILKYTLTTAPTESALLYGGLGLAAILSLPAFTLKAKAWKYLFAAVVLVSSIGWLIFAANASLSHLQPPTSPPPA